MHWQSTKTYHGIVEQINQQQKLHLNKPWKSIDIYNMQGKG